MNAFPPPTTPPVEPTGPVGSTPRRRGLIVGALVGAGALLAGGIVVGVALADDGSEPAAAEADPAAQTEGGGMDAVFEAVGPFLTCLGDNLDLDGVEIPDDPADMSIEDLPAVLDEAMAAGEAAFEACSDELPTDVPLVVPGPDLLDDLAGMDLEDIPGLSDLWAELAEVFGLPSLDDAEAQLDEAFEELPSWGELEDQIEQHLEDFDLRELPRLDEMFEDFDPESLPGLDEMFEDFDPESLPGLDEMFDGLEEELEGLDLDGVFDELFEEVPGAAPSGDGGG